MSKMSIADAALHLGVSKEAIHNRIRRGSLQSVIEDGVKYVVLGSDAKTAPKTNAKPTTRRTSSKPPAIDDRYYKLLEEQNEKLQQKVDKLEGETKTLREQKEQMLIHEREKIEQIYKDKDEQLKNILNAISSKFLLNTPQEEPTQEVVEAEVDEPRGELISLKKYLKKQNYSPKKLLKAKKRFDKVLKKESRFIKVGKKYYLDTLRYDYGDLS